MGNKSGNQYKRAFETESTFSLVSFGFSAFFHQHGWRHLKGREGLCPTVFLDETRAHYSWSPPVLKKATTPLINLTCNRNTKNKILRIIVKKESDNSDWLQYPIKEPIVFYQFLIPDAQLELISQTVDFF